MFTYLKQTINLQAKSAQIVASISNMRDELITLNASIEDVRTKNQEEMGTVSRLNEFMQKFNVINEFEEHGLFFGQGIVKLNKIYTIKDIQDSLKEVIDLL